MTRNGKLALAAGIIVAIVLGLALSELLVGTAENRNPGGSSASAPSGGSSLGAGEGGGARGAGRRQKPGPKLPRN